VVIFGVLTYFVVDGIILLFVALVELLGLCVLPLLMVLIWLFVSSLYDLSGHESAGSLGA
jgi:hypothetical protein